jgi:hypothetical protein
VAPKPDPKKPDEQPRESVKIVQRELGGLDDILKYSAEDIQSYVNNDRDPQEMLTFPQQIIKGFQPEKATPAQIFVSAAFESMHTVLLLITT